jgi:thiamine pyrophosphate-dependent acetolactate synthase large subunit-like protein
MPEIPENPMFDMKPNALIYGARYDRMMEAFGGKGFFVEDPKDLKGALEEAMNHAAPPSSTSCSRRAPPANRSSSAGTADRLTPSGTGPQPSPVQP